MATGELEFHPEPNELLSTEQFAERALFRLRRIVIAGAITDYEAARVTRLLEYLAIQSYGPVRVLLMSPGGGVFAGWAIYDAIRLLVERGVEIVVEVRGYAASMAAIILQAASRRLIAKNARLLIHEVSQSMLLETETASQSSERAEELGRLTGEIVTVLSRRMGWTELEVAGLIKKSDVWLTSAQALEFKLVDEII